VGSEQGDFNHFDENGTLVLTIQYKDGGEMKLDNEKLPPPYQPAELMP
jgi:hypothetical protein